MAVVGGQGPPRAIVLIGFMATRATSGSPVVMPPSIPPERFVSRK